MKRTRTEATIFRLAHELAASCRCASPDAAINRMLRDHNRRAALGEDVLPPLGPKALAVREWFAELWLSGSSDYWPL